MIAGQKIKREILRIVRQIRNLKVLSKKNKECVRVISKSRTHRPRSEIILPQRARGSVLMVCAFKGRHNILEKIINETLVLNKKKQKIMWFLVGTTKEDYQFIQNQATTKVVGGFITHNRPLGAKWQAAIFYATKKLRFDLAGIVGSDDFISNQLVRSVLSLRKKDLYLKRAHNIPVPAMYGVSEWLMVCSNEQKKSMQVLRCCYNRKMARQPLGAGRFYTREFISHCNSNLFDENKDRGLDCFGWEQLKRNEENARFLCLKDGIICSLKGNWESINSSQLILAAPSIIKKDITYMGKRVILKNFSQKSAAFLLSRQMP